MRIPFNPAAIARFLAFLVAVLLLHRMTGIGDPLSIVVVTTGTSTVLMGLALAQRSRARAGEGWKYLTAGPMLWFAFICATGLSGVLGYVYFFVGSARPDAAVQMRVLLCLLVAFSLAAVLTGLEVLVGVRRWNDLCVQQRTGWFSVREIRWADIEEARPGAFGDQLILRGRDGTKIALSSSFGGFEDLLRELPARLGHEGSPERRH